MNAPVLATLAVLTQILGPHDSIWVPAEEVLGHVDATKQNVVAGERIQLYPAGFFDASGRPLSVSSLGIGVLVEDESGWEKRLIVDGSTGPVIDRVSSVVWTTAHDPVYLALKAGRLILVAGARTFDISDEAAGSGASLQVGAAGDRWAAQVVLGSARLTFTDTGMLTKGMCTVHFSSNGRWAALWHPSDRTLTTWGDPRPASAEGVRATTFRVPAGESLSPRSVSFSPEGEIAFLTGDERMTGRLYVEGALAAKSSLPGSAPRERGAGSLDVGWNSWSAQTLESLPFNAFPCTQVAWIPVLSPSSAQVATAVFQDVAGERSSVLVGRSEWMVDGPLQEVLAMDPERGPLVVRTRNGSDVYVSLGDSKGPVVSRILDAAVVDSTLHYAAIRDSGDGEDWRMYRGLDMTPSLSSKDFVGPVVAALRQRHRPEMPSEKELLAGMKHGRVSHVAMTSAGIVLVRFGDHVMAAQLSPNAPPKLTVLGTGSECRLLSRPGRDVEQILWTDGRAVHLGSLNLCEMECRSPSVEFFEPDRIALTGCGRRITLERRTLGELPAIQSTGSTVERLNPSANPETPTHMLLGAVRGSSLDLAVVDAGANDASQPGQPKLVGSIPLSGRLLEALGAYRGSARMSKEQSEAWRPWRLPVRLEHADDKLVLTIEGFWWEPRPGSRKTSTVFEAPVPISLRSGPYAQVDSESQPFKGRIWPVAEGVQAFHRSWTGAFLVTVPWSSVKWKSVDG